MVWWRNSEVIAMAPTMTGNTYPLRGAERLGSLEYRGPINEPEVRNARPETGTR